MSQDVSQTGGARGYSWPPFEPGNSVARTHGAYAVVTDQELDGKLAEVYNALAADAPVRGADGGLPAADAPAVRLLADTLVRLDRIKAHIDEHGWGGRGRGSLLEHEGRLRSLSIELLREMGMTPLARAKLGLDLARSVDLAQQYAAEAEAEDAVDADAVEVDADG